MSGDKKVKGSKKKLGLSFFARPSGVLMMLNLLLSLICFFLTIGWTGSPSSYYQVPLYLATTVHAIVMLVFYIIIVAKKNHCCFSSPKGLHFTMFIHTTITALTFIVFSGILAVRASKLDYAVSKPLFVLDMCSINGCDTLAAAAGIGLVTAVSLIAEASFHAWEWQIFSK